jgi:hypothetical protein
MVPLMTTNKQLPQEYIDSYIAWDTYMAKVWLSLLKYCDISPLSTIIEIAPGTSRKIGLALSEIHFRGQIYIVEPCQLLLEKVSNQYKQMLPLAKIVPIDAKLVECYESIPKHADFILSNHPIDDMLISYETNKKEQDQLFEWTLSGDLDLPAIFLKKWLMLTSNMDQLLTAKSEVEKEWKQSILFMQPRNVIISQYASDALNKSGLSELNAHANDILVNLKRFFDNSNKDEDIQSVLNLHENYNNHHIRTEILNADNWMVYRQ